MRKVKKSFLFILILFISVGFAILTANLSIGSVLSFRQNSFDVHIEKPSIYETSTAVDSTASLTNSTTLTFNTTYTKPGDAVDILFYIVNDGTVDASISSITTTLTSAQSEYITYRFNYVTDNSLVGNNDVIYAGQTRKVIGHFEYKYDIDDFISLDNFSTSVTINFVQAQSSNNNVWAYEYVGDYQTFVAPKTGSYKIELWGASGGGMSDYPGGKGAYTSGKINLEKGDTLYIYVGGEGSGGSDNTYYPGGYNGGYIIRGQATFQGKRYYHGGGGATDIRLVSGNWDNFNSLKYRIMSAAGGGGSYYDSTNSSIFSAAGGSAGGLNGYSGASAASPGDWLPGTGAKQTEGGYATCSSSYCGNQWHTSKGTNLGDKYYSEFGYSVGNIVTDSMNSGGGGYYGGGSSMHVYGAGGGGSSYISGHNGCVAIEESSTSDNITFPTKNGVACTDGTTDQDCSVHYSGKEFTDTKMIDGKGYNWTTEVGNSVVGMPKYIGSGTMNGNSGDGYAKITLEDSILCKRATSLHTTTCNSAESTKACRKNSVTGYSTGDTIVYGNIPNNKNYKSGDAFDCDVNGNGVFDSDKERFYYVTDLDTNNKYAVLLYSYPTVTGVAVSSGNINVIYNSSGISYLGPVGYISHLPSITQWPKVRLYNYRRQLKNENGTLVSGEQNLSIFKYTNLTSRILTYQEVYKACNNNTSWQKQCEYLYEHTSYDSTNYPANWGIFLENPVSNNSGRVVRLDSHQLNTGISYEANDEHFAAKPVIEVPKSRME